MKLSDHLSVKQKKEIQKLSVSRKECPERRKFLKEKEEKLTQRDLEELMGTKRDTYKRVKGAVRRK
ncbi:hypothetical protein [Peribacillus alkalitolerans]|uniref:hypothetical protein n=1 Tax=Peribacillus alkalitolerans TaxID=1550385 RepID=UPI0013D09494|nr:hypothetical protein [Peribacillus alkalitolerans]